jgi:hypothetical protein
MFSNRFVSLTSGIFFLLISLAAGYRLLHFVPITIGSVEIRGPAIFFIFVIFAALSIIAFMGMRNNDKDLN